MFLSSIFYSAWYKSAIFLVTIVLFCFHPLKVSIITPSFHLRLPFSDLPPPVTSPLSHTVNKSQISPSYSKLKSNKSFLKNQQMPTSFFLFTSLLAFSLRSHPSRSHSPVNTKQSFHILRRREKTARKMTKHAEKRCEKGVAQRS